MSHTDCMSSANLSTRLETVVAWSIGGRISTCLGVVFISFTLSWESKEVTSDVCHNTPFIRTCRVHQTSYMRNPARRLLCKVLSCVDTRGVILLLWRGLLRFRKRKYEKIGMLEKARRYDMTNLISTMVKCRMCVHIMPRMSLVFPSMISSKKRGVSWIDSIEIMRYLLDQCGKFDTSRCDKLQSHVHIFGFLDSHARILVISAKRDTAYPTISLWCLGHNIWRQYPWFPE